MFSPPTFLNAQNQQQINNIQTSAPLVPAKRKRTTAALPEHPHVHPASQQQQQQQQQIQQQHPQHPQSQPTSAHPSLAPRSFSVYGQGLPPPRSSGSYPPSLQHPPSSAPSATALQSQSNTNHHHHVSPAKNINLPTANINGGGETEDIHCICGYEDDDGYTIACDDCGRWSHMVCFDISVGRDPPEWRCWECAPRPVNRERARERQAARVAAQIQGRLGPFVGAPEVQALAQAAAESRQRKSRNRRTSVLTMANAHAPPVSAAHSGGNDAGGNEGEHIDIDDWRTSYVPIAEDLIPHASTRAKLRLAAQNWRGVTALSPEEPDFSDPGSASTSTNPKTKVVPLPNGKDDVAAAVRPPSYALQTTTPIANESLITPFTSTIIPSAHYLADPLNGYAQMGLPKPHVHLVPPPLSVALDARMAGNEARFIRSGCRPNAVLRPVLCPSKKEKQRETENSNNSAVHAEPGTVKFAVYALRDLKASEEVVLSWEWDDGCVVHQLPALVEEGMRSGVNGAGPSKMTPHHIERLRLQMQSIVESLKSSFVTCACGGAARDCAVRLMEAFAEGEIPWLNGARDRDRQRQKQATSSSPKAAKRQNNLQPDAARTGSYNQRQSPSGSSPMSRSTPHQQPDAQAFMPQNPGGAATNRHPSSMNDLKDLTSYMSAKARARIFGPLVGEERGVRTKLVGGPLSGGLQGVQQVNGDRWDRFGELEDETAERRSTSVPLVRVQEPSPMKGDKGMGVLRGPNGLRARLEQYADDMTGRGSPLRSSLEPEPGSKHEEEGREPTPSPASEVEMEKKMPPRMRKRWIQQKSESLKSEILLERSRRSRSSSSDGIGLSMPSRETHASKDAMEVDDIVERPRSSSDRTPSPAQVQTPSLPHVEKGVRDINLDSSHMPPPPPTATTSSRASPRLSEPPITASTIATSTQSAQSQPPKSRSSLFSLLNDQPVSPILHSHRHLAQIMNPPTASIPPRASTFANISAAASQTPSPSVEIGNVEHEHELFEEPTAAPILRRVEEERLSPGAMDVDDGKEEHGRVNSEQTEPLPSFVGVIVHDNSRRSEADVLLPVAEIRDEEVEAESITRRPPTPSCSLSPRPPAAEEVLSGLERKKEPTPSTASPSVHSSFREPTPPVVHASARSQSPVPAEQEADERFSSPLSPVDSASRDVTGGRSTSVESSGEAMATHDIHELVGGPGAPAPNVDEVVENPAMLFKEELMEAAVELAKTQKEGQEVVRVSDADVELILTQHDDEDEARMSVDESLRVPERNYERSASPSMSTSISRLSSLPPEMEADKVKQDMDVDGAEVGGGVDVEVKPDIDEEMHDAHSASASPLQQAQNSLTPSVEVQKSSSIQQQKTLPPSMRLRSSVDEAKAWTAVPEPESDSHEDKKAVLSAASAASERGSAPVANDDAISVPEDAAPVVNNARLRDSPDVLRAPSPAASVVSSGVARPSPSVVVPSDTEREHARGEGREVPETLATAFAPPTPVEPQKIRRSMADYKQRKRKEREEQAARAALASPISPTSPLRQLLVSTEMTTIVEPPIHEVEKLAVGNGDSRKTGAQAQEEEQARKVNEDRSMQNHDSTAASASADTSHTTPQMPKSITPLKSPEISVHEASHRSSSPKREATEDRFYFSQSPALENRVPPIAQKCDASSGQEKAHSPPVSPTSNRSKGRPGSPQPAEDGEILNAPPRTTASPTMPRALSSGVSNARAGRTSIGSKPPSAPRSLRGDSRRIPSDSPPLHYRDLPSSTSGKKEPPPPITIRRGQSYVPPPSKASPGATSTSSLSGLRGNPPTGPRALLRAQLGDPVKAPPPTRTLAERVERAGSRERDRDFDKDRDRDRDHDRERERDRDRDRERDRDRDRDSREIRGYDRYSPPRGRYAGRSWGRRR